MYKEVSFQSIFSLRSGGVLPQRSTQHVKQLADNAKASIMINKTFTAIFIAVFGAIIFLPLPFKANPGNTPASLSLVGNTSAFLAVVLFLIMIMGLQVTTSFVSTKLGDILGALPLSRNDVSSIFLMTFLRMFDVPLLTAIIVLITTFFISTGSIIGGLMACSGLIATEVFALALTVASAKFFYAKVANGGRSRWKAVQRLIFMSVWVLPSLGSYLVMNFAVQISELFASIMQNLSPLSNLLVLVYPFSFGFLASLTTFAWDTGVVSILLPGVMSVVYFVLALYSLRWLAHTMRSLGSGGIVKASIGGVEDTIVHPHAPWIGVILKDLRMSSRSPSYASLFLLPVIQTLVLTISLTPFGEVGLNITEGVLTGMTIVTLLLPPTLFSIEGIAFSYTRSLPVRKRTLILAKTVLSAVTYLISLTTLIAVALYFGRDFRTILAFGIVHTFSLLAAIMLELEILTRRFWSEGFALGNIYSRFSEYLMILFPGLVIAMMPMAMTSVMMKFMAPNLVIILFLLMSLSELLVSLIVVLLDSTM